jgi:hypothetical protein
MKREREDVKDLVGFFIGSLKKSQMNDHFVVDNHPPSGQFSAISAEGKDY